MKLLLTLILTFSFNIAYATDVASSWSQAKVFVPGSFKPVTVKDIKSNQNYPVIVYLHGCTGIVDWHDHDWGKTLSSHGYLVILIDSMARNGRIPNCDPVTKTAGFFPQAHEYRQEEITYALEEIAKVDWADKNQIFLMGYSEGGIAVASSTHRSFRANIILAWTCTFRNHKTLDGIKSPKEIPILAVAAKYDVWRVGKASEGRCIDKADGRPLIQVDLNGSEHATTKYPESKPAVLDFLKSFK
jgi:dienelactone hydrolase